MNWPKSNVSERGLSHERRPELDGPDRERAAPKRKPRLNVAVDIVDGPNGIELVLRTTRNERGAA